MKKNILTLFLFALIASVFCLNSFSSTDMPDKKKKKKKQETEQQAPTINTPVGDTVSLVVSSKALTKELAIRNALRDAIEQTYGTFVSANTTVVNDSLVKDEIATVTSGNVLSYREVSCIQETDGNYNVTVQAVVSIGRLVEFAKSHGMTAELAGNTFVMNRNLAKLAQENEKKAILNLIEQVKLISSKGLYDFSIKTGEPRIISYDEKYHVRSHINTDEDLFSVGIYLTATKNNNFTILEDLVNNTLGSLNMSEEESKNYEKLGMQTAKMLVLRSGGGLVARGNEIICRNGIRIGDKKEIQYENDLTDLIIISNWIGVGGRMLRYNYDVSDMIDPLDCRQLNMSYNLQNSINNINRRLIPKYDIKLKWCSPHINIDGNEAYYYFRNNIDDLLNQISKELFVNLVNFNVYDNLGNEMIVSSDKRDYDIWWDFDICWGFGDTWYSRKLICKSDQVIPYFSHYRGQRNEHVPLFFQGYSTERGQYYPGFVLIYKESDLAKLQSISVKSRYNQ